MFRTVLTALVLATGSTAGVAACGGGESAGPKVVAGAPAGDVFDLRGTVTATRDGETRTLAKGDVVSGDDLIDTGVDGNVAIRLRHNLVPWTLGPGKQEQVGLSLAWKAPRSTQTVAGPTGERSGAAGRHAEREAADTAATAAAGAEVAMAAPEAAAAPGGAPPPPPSPVAATAPAAPPPPAAPTGPADEAPLEREKMAPRADKKEDTGALLGDSAGDSFGTGGLGLSGTGKGGGGTGEGSIGLGSIGTLGHGGGTGTGQGYGAGAGAGAPRGGGARAKPSKPQAIVRVFAARGGLDTAIVTRVVRARNPRLIACVEPDAPARAMVKLTIKPDGKVDAATVSGVSQKASQCLEKWMRATAFPSAKEPTSVSVLVQAPDPLDGL